MNLTNPANLENADRFNPDITYLSYLTSPSLLFLSLLVLLPACAYLIYRDYCTFLSLGPGGTPRTVSGYLRICVLRVFALKNPYAPCPIPDFLRPHTGNLLNMPQRAGPRPQVAGIAPHRQTTQRASPVMFAALTGEIATMAHSHPGRLRVGTSCFETHGMGLFSEMPLNRTCNGEICHAHAIDGSLHMTLHPADAKRVLERGWGERHPLAKGGFFTRFVPPTFVMVYAPRDENELKIVMDIIRAAVWWVSGQKLWEGQPEGRGTKSGGEKGGMGLLRRTLTDSHGMLLAVSRNGAGLGS